MTPLLTIAIPTYRRAAYLEMTLAHLKRDMLALPPGQVEIVISDNASPDDTAGVVTRAMEAGLPIRLMRNAENIGSDANIAQVFNLAMGRHVLILGDDDILTQGTLSRLLEILDAQPWGVVYLRPFGYDVDIAREHPGDGGRDLPIHDADAFLVALGAHLTLISALVINKDLLADTDARSFIGGNLVQVHLAVLAMLRGSQNLYSTRYGVACKRNNSGGYLFARVFVGELGKILDSYVGRGLTAAGVRRYDTKLLLSYHPTYVLKTRLNGENTAETLAIFRRRFGRRLLFWVWIAPTLMLPVVLARPWGWFTITAGRLLFGDLRRGLAFLRAFGRRRVG